MTWPIYEARTTNDCEEYNLLNLEKDILLKDSERAFPVFISVSNKYLVVVIVMGIFFNAASKTSW